MPSKKENIKILDCFVYQERLFLVMEYIKERSLMDILEKIKLMSEEYHLGEKLIKILLFHILKKMDLIHS